MTLFATGDSITAGHLQSVIQTGYEEDSTLDPKVAEYLHISEVFERADEFDLIHSHYDFMALDLHAVDRHTCVDNDSRIFIAANHACV